MGTGEILFVLFMVVMLFGTDKLPEIARGLGKLMRQLKDATNDIKREINNSADMKEFNIDKISKMREEVKSAVNKEIKEFTGPIKRNSDLKDFDKISKIKNDIKDSVNKEIKEITKPVKRKK